MHRLGKLKSRFAMLRYHRPIYCHLRVWGQGKFGSRRLSLLTREREKKREGKIREVGDLIPSWLSIEYLEGGVGWMGWDTINEQHLMLLKLKSRVFNVQLDYRYDI